MLFCHKMTILFQNFFREKIVSPPLPTEVTFEQTFNCVNVSVELCGVLTANSLRPKWKWWDVILDRIWNKWPRRCLFSLANFGGLYQPTSPAPTHRQGQHTHRFRSDIYFIELVYAVGLIWMWFHALMQRQIVKCDFIKSFIRIHQWDWIRKRSLCKFGPLTPQQHPSLLPSLSFAFTLSFLSHLL